MNLILFIVLPLLAAFVVGLLRKIPLFQNGWLPTVALFGSSLGAALLLPSALEGGIIEVVVIKPPLGINLFGGSLSILLIMVTSLFGMVLTSSPKLRYYFRKSGKINVLFLLHLAGVNGLFLSGDLFNLFVFLEITALSAYALTTMSETAKSFEAALKYLLAGSIASLFLLLGIALVYNYTGTLNLAELSRVAPAIPVAAHTLIVVFLLASLSLEAELFPLNLWVPDVYEGSGAALSGLFSTMTLKAALYLLFRVVQVLQPNEATFELLLWIGLISMIVAELAALKQKNVVRMLAYSSMAQAGFLVAAFAVGINSGVVLHIISHSATKAGLFLIASLVIHRGGGFESLRGIGVKNRFVGFVFVVLILSLLGLPPFTGFLGKFIILKEMTTHVGILPVIMVLIASLIEAWYLLKLLSLVFDRKEENPVAITMKHAITLLLPLLFLVGIGLFPKVIEKNLEKGADDLGNVKMYQQTILQGGNR